MNVELLHRWKCPYSAKVRAHIGKLELEEEIPYREIGEDAEALKTLQDLTGGTQVPCLLIDGKPLQESDDIIEWLDENMASSSSSEQNLEM